MADARRRSVGTDANARASKPPSPSARTKSNAPRSCGGGGTFVVAANDRADRDGGANADRRAVLCPSSVARCGTRTTNAGAPPGEDARVAAVNASSVAVVVASASASATTRSGAARSHRHSRGITSSRTTSTSVASPLARGPNDAAGGSDAAAGSDASRARRASPEVIRNPGSVARTPPSRDGIVSAPRQRSPGSKKIDRGDADDGRVDADDEGRGAAPAGRTITSAPARAATSRIRRGASRPPSWWWW